MPLPPSGAAFGDAFAQGSSPPPTGVDEEGAVDATDDAFERHAAVDAAAAAAAATSGTDGRYGGYGRVLNAVSIAGRGQRNRSDCRVSQRLKTPNASVTGGGG